MTDRRPRKARVAALVLAVAITTGCGERASTSLPLSPGIAPDALADCLQSRLPALAEAAPDHWPVHAVERSTDGHRLAWRPLVPRSEIGYALDVDIDDAGITLRIEAMGPYGSRLDGTTAQLDAAQRIARSCIDALPRPVPALP